jgi:hypothetical protein
LFKGSLLYNKLRASVKHCFCWQNSWVHMSSVSKRWLLHSSPCYTFNQNAHLHSNFLKWDIVILLWSWCRDFCTLKFCDYENNFFFMISNWTSFSCAHKVYTTYLYMLPRIQNTSVPSIWVTLNGMHVYCTIAINQCTGSWNYMISPVMCQGIKLAFKHI